MHKIAISRNIRFQLNLKLSYQHLGTPTNKLDCLQFVLLQYISGIYGLSKGNFYLIAGMAELLY